VSRAERPEILVTDELLKATRALAQMAKAEDLGTGDVTSMLLEPQGDARFELLLKQPAVLAGRAIAGEILEVYDETITIEWEDEAVDGAFLDRSQRAAGSSPRGVPQQQVRLAILTGPNRSILATERVLLNFLQRLCGVATLTRTYADAVAGTDAKVYDTRKTTPGWRLLEKYAVRCGGGFNHRMGLYDAVLIKDNHLADVEPQRLSFAVFEMLNRVASGKTSSPTRGDATPGPQFIMVEADMPEQAEELFKVIGIDVVMLDNFSLDDLRWAVERRNELGLAGKIELEASGGITLETIGEIACTGVDRISVGALTHSATAVDLSLARV